MAFLSGIFFATAINKKEKFNYFYTPLTMALLSGAMYLNWDLITYCHIVVLVN
jgi:hypothetical protein